MGYWLDQVKEKKFPDTAIVGTAIGAVGARGESEPTELASSKGAVTEPATEGDNVISLHRMRDVCQAAGHCLVLTRELDCALYLVRLGWCRDRVIKGVIK